MRDPIAIAPRGSVPPVSTAVVDFNNEGGAARPAFLVFDLRALPKSLALSFRLPSGLSAAGPVNVTARPATASDAPAPAGFGDVVYDVTPSSRGEVEVGLGPFGVVRAFLEVRRTGPVRAGARYAFEVQQWAPRLVLVKALPAPTSRFLVGGSTFVVPIAGPSAPPPTTTLPPPEHHEEGERFPYAPPWAATAARDRRRELTAGEAPGPRVTGVRVTNDRPDYSGACPITITFRGTITTAGGAGVLSYVWDRSDGAVGRVQQLRVTGPGDHVVSTTWTLGQAGMAYRGSMALRVLGPGAASAPSAFAIRCAP